MCRMTERWGRLSTSHYAKNTSQQLTGMFNAKVTDTYCSERAQSAVHASMSGRMESEHTAHKKEKNEKKNSNISAKGWHIMSGVRGVQHSLQFRAFENRTHSSTKKRSIETFLSANNHLFLSVLLLCLHPKLWVTGAAHTPVILAKVPPGVCAFLMTMQFDVRQGWASLCVRDGLPLDFRAASLKKKKVVLKRLIYLWIITRNMFAIIDF